MNRVQDDLLKVLAYGRTRQDKIIERLDNLLLDHGRVTLRKWYNSTDATGNSLLHELVQRDLDDVLAHVLREDKWDCNLYARRSSDRLTPYELAEELRRTSICELLKTHDADRPPQDEAAHSLTDEEKENMMNIIWMDLEMTSLEEPEILECAVIITDKNLVELARGKCPRVPLERFIPPLVIR